VQDKKIPHYFLISGLRLLLTSGFNHAGFIMDQRAIVSIDIQKDGSVFSFHMPLGAKWSAAYDAALDLVKGMEQHFKEMEAAEKAKAPAADTTQPIEPEVVQKEA
jgi:hypothetical protein